MGKFFIVIIVFFVIAVIFLFFITIDYESISSNEEKDVGVDYFQSKLIKSADYSYLIKNSKISEPSSRINMIGESDLINNITLILNNREYKNEYEKVYLAYNLVKDLPYKETSYLQSPIETLNYGGDCADKALLFTALLSKIGIKSYVVETNDNNFITHSFNLVYINGKWHMIDVTNGLFFYDFNDADIILLYNDKEIRTL